MKRWTTRRAANLRRKLAYYALVKLSAHETKAATDAADARWFPVAKAPKLAFDHAEILATALARLKGKVRYQPIGFELLPPKFTLSQLQHLYEAVLETELDKRNFRKKVLGFELLVPLKETLMTGRHRPAQLFSFDADKYEKLKKRGFNFEL
jgi:8-oxo-dGTP diphosphatase